MSDCNLGELLRNKLESSKPATNVAPKYHFPSSPFIKSIESPIPHVCACILFREAVGCTLGEAHRYLQLNFPEGNIPFRKMGEMIYAYYHR